MFSQLCSYSSLLNSLRTMRYAAMGKIILSISTTSILMLVPISMVRSQVSGKTPTQSQPYTTKTQLLTQFPHHTSASSTLGFLVTNYSVYCQTNGSETMDTSTFKPLCGGSGGEAPEGEGASPSRLAHTPDLPTTPLEPIVLFQNDKAILFLGDL